MIYILPSCFCTQFSFTSVEITDFVWLSPLAIFTESSEWAVFTVNLQSSVSFRILRFIYQTHNNKRFHSQWVFSRNSWQNSADRKNGEESQKLKNKLSFYLRCHRLTGWLTDWLTVALASFEASAPLYFLAPLNTHFAANFRPITFQFRSSFIINTLDTDDWCD